MTRTHNSFVPLVGLLATLAAMPALAAPMQLAKAPALTACDPPGTFQSPGPYFGDWNVTQGDGTTFSVNFHQVLGALINNVTGTITSQPAPNLKILRGVTLAVKGDVHLFIIVSGQKGDLLMSMAPNGQSFVGVGHLADGTPVTWMGQQAPPAGAGAPPPTTQPTDAPPPQPQPAQAPPAQPDQAPAQADQPAPQPAPQP
jgi:hypothetical protein